MSEELKPCPFCGGKAEYDNSDCGPYEWIVCTHCGAKGPVMNYNNDALGTSRDAWNKRICETPPAAF
jgi:Lar family restriction alleviation protein